MVEQRWRAGTLTPPAPAPHVEALGHVLVPVARVGEPGRAMPALIPADIKHLVLSPHPDRNERETRRASRTAAPRASPALQQRGQRPGVDFGNGNENNDSRFLAGVDPIVAIKVARAGEGLAALVADVPSRLSARACP